MKSQALSTPLWTFRMYGVSCNDHFYSREAEDATFFTDPISHHLVQELEKQL